MNAMEKRVIDWIDARQDALNALLCELIGFDSQNLAGDGREQALAEHMAALYREMGLETELFCPDSVPGLVDHPLYWPGHNTHRRPNATGVWRGQPGRGRVMLAAHTDTMPVGDAGAWTKPPFGGVIEDGRIYGLGSGDDKASLAAAAFAVQALQAAGIKPSKDVVLGAYCDEEFGGGNGALGLVMRQPCDDVLNLDGSGYEMWATSLGGGVFRVELTLDHVTDDCAAIYRALQRTMDALEAFGQRRREELAANAWYAGTQTQRSAYRVAAFGSCPNSHERAFVDFVIYTIRTKAEIYGELQAILDGLKGEYDRLGIREARFTGTTRFFDYGESDTEGGAFPVMKACAEEASGGEVPVRGSCLTDLSAIMPIVGPRCFNFGIFRDFSLPGGAHQPDEYVECRQLRDLTCALALFLIRYCCA